MLKFKYINMPHLKFVILHHHDYTTQKLNVLQQIVFRRTTEK